MKISEAVRARTDERDVPEQEALQRGIERKFGEVIEKAGELHSKA